MSKETELIKTSQQRNILPDSFTGEFYNTFKDKLMLISLKLFQKIDEGTFQNSFYAARVMWPATKARYRHNKKRKLQADIPDEYK